MPRPRSAAAPQLDEFLGRYTPEIAARARDVLARLRHRLPGAVELVYDNYNALVVGFGPSEKTSEAVLSVALYPRWVTLFFLRGARLPDPTGILRGSGSVVRHVVLDDAADLDRPAVRALLEAAVAGCPFDLAVPRRIVVKSVSAKQRPRRPPPAKAPRARLQPRKPSR